MTSTDWFAARDPGLMLRFVPESAHPRKLRLFACACCRRWWPFLPPSGREAIALSEKFADGNGDAITLANAARAADIASAEESPERACLLHACGVAARHELGWDALDATDALAEAAAYRVAHRKPSGSRWVAAWSAEFRACAQVLREIVGDPFRPSTLDPRWLTSPVLDLARAIHDTQDFAAMPILADALEESGCDCPDLLAHCRGPGPHARGCWVVDLVLGKV